MICIGGHPPFFVLNGYIHRLWAKNGINKVAMLKIGIVLDRFDTNVGKDEVIQGGLDPGYGVLKGGVVHSSYGVLKGGVDAHRGGHTLPLPAKIVFKNKIGNLIKQKVQYDWRPTLCKFCKNYGHTVEECKKKNKPQSELITKQLVVVSPAQVTEMTKDNSVEMNQERLKTVGNKEGTGKTEVLTNILEGRRRMVTPLHTNKQQARAQLLP
ncbi:hypothetical protein H5410_040865, partial [Solanum commersonii]